MSFLISAEFASTLAHRERRNFIRLFIAGWQIHCGGGIFLGGLSLKTLIGLCDQSEDVEM